MHIVALIAPIPPLSDLTATRKQFSRRQRNGWELNPYCRRAVAQATLLAHQYSATLDFLTAGPDSVAGVLHEAITWASQHGVLATGMHAGSGYPWIGDFTQVLEDILVGLVGLQDWDLLIAGASTPTAGSGMIPHYIGAYFGRPVVERVESMSPTDHGWMFTTDEGATIEHPADPLVITCAERLITPCKVPHMQWLRRDSLSIRYPFPAEKFGCPYLYSDVRIVASGTITFPREGIRLAGTPRDQVHQVCEYLERSGACSESPQRSPLSSIVPELKGPSPTVIFIPDDEEDEQTLPYYNWLSSLGSKVVIQDFSPDFHTFVHKGPVNDESLPSLVAFPATSTGRARAATLSMVDSPVLLGTPFALRSVPDGLEVLQRATPNQWEVLHVNSGVPICLIQPMDVQMGARAMGIGQGIPRDEYERLTMLASKLDAEIVATRKVTDQGWIPRSHQIGITGSLIRPEIHFAVGTSGKPNHSIGYNGARVVVAINSDATAPVFDTANIGMVTDWDQGLTALAEEFEARGWGPRR